METPTKKEIEEGPKSHRVSGLNEELTPHTSAKEGSKFSTSGSDSASVTSPGDTTQDGQGGGVLGYVKSFIPGAASSSQGEAAPKSEKLTHSEDLKDGTSAEIHTATPPDSAVPTTIEQGPGVVGAARTDISEPVSPYAGALENIAGAPVAPDPTAKYGPALGALTGDAPAAGTGTGVVGAVSSAASTVVQTVKQAVFYETDSTSKTTVTEPSTDPLGPTPAAVTPAELPKSAVVNTQEDGTAAIEEKQAPGYLASAAGAVGGGAAYVKDTVAGLVGAGGGGATSIEPQTSKDANSVQSKPAVEYEGEAPTGGKTPELVPAGAATGAATSTAPTTADRAPSQDSVQLVTQQPPVSAFAASSTKAPEITEEGPGKDPVAEKNAQIVAQKEAAAKEAEAAKVAEAETKAAKKEADKAEEGKAKKGCCGCVIS